jgi:hypothetical protein
MPVASAQALPVGPEPTILFCGIAKRVAQEGHAPPSSFEDHPPAYGKMTSITAVEPSLKVAM